jgi:predicted TIM-barrel fold metal-dependent hydrolase
MRVDTQVHVVSADRDRYPLDPPPMDVPAWYERAALSADDLLVAMTGAGVDRAVLVQGFSAYRYDNRYTADAALAHPDRFASTCIVDVEDDPVGATRHWVTERGARAIRLFLQLGDGSWLDGAAADRVLDELTALGAIAQTAVTAEQLPGVMRAARRHPEPVFFVDHCGFPDFSDGPGYPHAQSLFRLADAPNVSVKLSTHVFERARDGGATPREVTDAIVAAFGAERVMWASDVSVQERPYAELVAEAESACAGLTERQRRLVLGETAARVWWPDER